MAGILRLPRFPPFSHLESFRRGRHFGSGNKGKELAELGLVGGTHPPGTVVMAGRVEAAVVLFGMCNF